MANDAFQVDFLLAGLTDTNGDALTAGKAHTYDAGTTNNKTTWTESDKSVAAANPVILDAYGRALIFADGNYKIVVKDSDDVTLYTWDNLEYGNQRFLLKEVAAPSGIADTIQLTGMADGPDTEFRVTDAAGNSIQMTKDGKINAIAGPGAVTDNRIITFNGATGLVVQGTSISIGDTGILHFYGNDPQIWLESTGNPTGTADIGKFSTKDVGSGVIEGIYTDAAGNNVQLTNAGAINVSKAALGTWDNTKVADTDYNAATDGFVVVMTATGTANWTVLTDGNTPPTPTIVRAKIQASGGEFNSTCTPVKKDDDWKVTLQNGTITIFFIPLS